MREITRLPAGELEHKAERMRDGLNGSLGTQSKGAAGRSWCWMTIPPVSRPFMTSRCIRTGRRNPCCRAFRRKGTCSIFLPTPGLYRGRDKKGPPGDCRKYSKGCQENRPGFSHYEPRRFHTQGTLSPGDPGAAGCTEPGRTAGNRRRSHLPLFKEGGRFTIGNIHYVRYGRELVPAGETEFAADRTFGYRSSNLADYVEEKTKGAYPAGEVICIGLDDLRHGRVDKVAGQLMEVRNFNKVIVNAVDYGDLKVFALALYEAMGQGKRFLFRTAAPW